MSEGTTERVYAPADIEARLRAELPAWSYGDGVMRRTYPTRNFKSTMMVANAIGHLAETAWHHPEMMLSYGAVEVRLSTHSAGGITDKDFELARRIEDLVTWRPAGGAALEGTPAAEGLLRD